MPVSTRWNESTTIHVATDIFLLAREFQSRLGRRNITEAWLDESDAELELVKSAAAGTAASLLTQKSTTESVKSLINQIGARVVAIRSAIRRVYPKRSELHRAFGVGQGTRQSQPAALAAIELIEEGATAYPAETAAAGILETDLTELLGLRDALRAADLVQEGAKSTKKSSTATRNSLLRSLTARIDRILGAAELEFVDEPEVLARFRSPIPTRKKKKS